MSAPLEGLFHRGDRVPPLLIAPSHPNMGSMESPIIAEVAWAVTRTGHATLRFNWSGVGASGGTFDESAAHSDAHSAAVHLENCVSNASSMALAGVGFGARVAAEMACEQPEQVPALILVCPELDNLPDLTRCTGETVVVFGQLDETVNKVDADRFVSSLPYGRLIMIPAADQRFLRGLVDLGRVVAETLAPPGMIDLG